jgi:beta-glucosidase
MKRFVYLLLLVAILLSACASGTPVDDATESATIEAAPGAETTDKADCYTKDLSMPIAQRVEKLLACMTLEEKIGQMTQVEKNSLRPGDITTYFIGSVLSGGGGSPDDNSPEGWAKMTNGLQDEALATRLGIPLIYGADAVHGHGNLKGATIFPQEIGLGAANEPGLVQRIGTATAEEMLATGVTWNFAPVLAVPQDIRWGRTYEAYSENTEIVSTLGRAYLRGLQTKPVGFKAEAGDTLYVLATPKHFLGDGGTAWGTSTKDDYKIDQGDMQVDEATLRALYLPPYTAAVEAGAMSVMASFSSWNGTKMHAQKYLLTDVLKGELGFKGFVVSDWEAIDQVDPNYYKAVVTAINAGVDMSMVPSDYINFIDTMREAVARNDISEERINDAVRRILTVKFQLGLFAHPYADPAMLPTVRSQAHLDLAREAVRKSLVLLKNDNNALPIAKDTPLILVAGQGSKDIGMQSGGWTITWQGLAGNITPGTTIVEGIQMVASPNTKIQKNRYGQFDIDAEVGIVVVGEQPYAEGMGDKADLRLDEADINAINNTRPHVKKLIVVILSGRPLVITDQYNLADAWVAAWLPGTEGQGIADVLFGDFPFTGKLPYAWPRTNEQLPINSNNAAGKTGCDGPLFPFGFGMVIGDPAPEIPVCP